MTKRPMNMTNSQKASILLTFLGLTSSSLALSEPEAEPMLKLDVPRLGTPINKPPLKGGVQHNDVLSPTPGKTLNGSAGASKSKLKGKAEAGTGLGGLIKRNAKTDVPKQDTLNAQAELGIGIIGVKFIMAFGRPPVINRVFPGTPAFDQGLRPDDIILAVDGVPTFGLTKDEVYSMIVGTPNTPVQLSIRRNRNFLVARMNRMDFNDIKDPRVRRDYQSM
jgi:hypothetical protein